MRTLQGVLTAALLIGAAVFVPTAPTAAEEASDAIFHTLPVTFEKVATGYAFTEGPAADKDGHVFFTDIRNSRILRFDVTTDKATVFKEDSGKSNGLHFDADGCLLACEGGRRRVVRWKGEESVVLADAFGGKKLNSPNDLTLDQAGGVWFTDPRYGKQDNLEQDVMAVYYQPKEGKLKQVIRELPRPNGIILSADGKTLFVAASSRKLIMAYPVTAPGVVGEGRVFAKLDDSRGGPDGMTLDAEGNLYCGGQGHIFVWSKTGKRLHKLPVPESPTNCTFGGPKRDVLYVTARTSLYRVSTKVKGAK